MSKLEESAQSICSLHPEIKTEKDDVQMDEESYVNSEVAGMFRFESSSKTENQKQNHEIKIEEDTLEVSSNKQPTTVTDYENEFGNPAKRSCPDQISEVLENRRLIRELQQQQKEILKRQAKMQSTLDALLTAINPPAAASPVPLATFNQEETLISQYSNPRLYNLTPAVIQADMEGFIELGGKDIQPPLLFSLDMYQRLLRANPKPTLLTKALMGELFTRAEMAVSNMGGKRGKEALDNRKITAICLQIDIQFSAAGIQLDAKEIKNAINDKCRYMKLFLSRSTEHTIKGPL